MQACRHRSSRSRLRMQRSQPRGKNRAWFGTSIHWLGSICHRLVISGMGAFQNRWAVVIVSSRTCSNERCRCPQLSPRLSMLVSRGEFQGRPDVCLVENKTDGREHAQITGHPHYLLGTVCSRQRRPRRVIALRIVDCYVGCQAQLVSIQ
jgi:hypothetical protein